MQTAVAEKDVLRTKKTPLSHEIERVNSPGATSGDVELVPGEIHADDELDGELATKKKLAKQTWNRDRSEQTRAVIRSELEPGSSGKTAIRVLHRLDQCYMLPGVD